MIITPRKIEVRHFHLFCGLGGGAKGFNRGTARVGNTSAAFRCVGGIDNDPAAIADFDRLAYEGKMWKANPRPDVWLLRWYGYSDKPGHVSNNQRRIILV